MWTDNKAKLFTSRVIVLILSSNENLSATNLTPHDVPAVPSFFSRCWVYCWMINAFAVLICLLSPNGDFKVNPNFFLRFTPESSPGFISLYLLSRRGRAFGFYSTSLLFRRSMLTQHYQNQANLNVLFDLPFVWFNPKILLLVTFVTISRSQRINRILNCNQYVNIDMIPFINIVAFMMST